MAKRSLLAATPFGMCFEVSSLLFLRIHFAVILCEFYVYLFFPTFLHFQKRVKLHNLSKVPSVVLVLRGEDFVHGKIVLP